VELRLDLPVGHDIISFEEIQQFVRLAELGGAEPSDPVVGVASDDEKNPEALHITVPGPTEWTPTLTMEKQLAIRLLSAQHPTPASRLFMSIVAVVPAGAAPMRAATPMGASSCTARASRCGRAVISRT